MQNKGAGLPGGVQEWAYEARRSGESWHDISVILGCTERQAYKSAWKHAKTRSLLWPLPDPSASPGFRWSQHEKRKLVQGYAAGIPAEELSRDLNRSIKAIYQMAARMRLKHPNATKASNVDPV